MHVIIEVTNIVLQSLLTFKPFQAKIPGIHVRRGDKVEGRYKEAPLVPVQMYMSEVNRYYDKMEVQGKRCLPRKLFVAADEVTKRWFALQ